MNTDQLEYYIRKALTRTAMYDGFLGALPKDYAKHVLNRASPSDVFCMAANTHTSTQPGQHWVAYIYNRGNLDFFDSYGSEPKQLRMPVGSPNRLEWNDVVLQDLDSDVCGHYCVYYLYMRARNCTTTRLYNPFTTNTKFNDSYVARFVCRNLGICNTLSCKNSCMQTCIARKYCV